MKFDDQLARICAPITRIPSFSFHLFSPSLLLEYLKGLEMNLKILFTLKITYIGHVLSLGGVGKNLKYPLKKN